MFIRLFFSFLFFLSVLFVTHVSAAEKGWYFATHLGLSSPDDTTFSYTIIPDDQMSYETGITFTGAGGYDFGMFRVAGEFSYAYNEVDQYRENFTYNLTFNAEDGAVDVTSLMCNLYFDIENKSPLTPYIMGGVGISYVEIYDLVLRNGGTILWFFDQDDTVLAYQLGAGVEYSFNQSFSLDVTYRYITTDDLDFFTGEGTYEADRFLAGIRVKF